VTKLTPKQKLTLDLLKLAKKDEDGYTGLMWTEPIYRIEDDTAWIYFRTALSLEKKGLVELDYRFGRVKLRK
jgi:hypothetical protein